MSDDSNADVFSTNDLQVTVDADTDEFVEQIERATHAIEEFRAACDRLEKTPVSVRITSLGDSTFAEVEVPDE